MAFTIDIGVTTDNDNKINKSVSWLSGESGVTIHPTSVLSQLAPVFVIDYNANFLTANYVRADFFGRSYNALVSVDTAGKMLLSCNVDFLAFNFSNCPITVVRSGSIGAPTEIPDNKLPVKPSTEKIEQIPISNNEFKQLLTYPYVLQVIGG